MKYPTPNIRQTDSSSSNVKQLVIATSLAFTLSTALYVQQNILPSGNYDIPMEKKKTWEDNYGFVSLTDASTVKLIQKAEILKSFALKMLEQSEDLNPEIVSLVNKNFWDMF